MMFSSLSVSRHKETSKVSSKTSAESLDQQTVRQINRSEFPPDYQQLIKANLELRQQYSEIKKEVREQAKQIQELHAQRLDLQRQVKLLGRQLENAKVQREEWCLKLIRIMLLEKATSQKRILCNSSLSKDISTTYSIEQLEKYRRNIYKLSDIENDNQQSQQNTVFSSTEPIKQLTLSQTLKMFLRHHLNTISLYQQKIQTLQQQIVNTNSLAATAQTLNLLIPKLQADFTELNLLRKQQRLTLRSQQIYLKIQQHEKQPKVSEVQPRASVIRLTQEDECKSVEEQMEMIRQSHIGCEVQSYAWSVYSICKKVLDDHRQEEQNKRKKIPTYAITRRSSRHSARQSNRQSNTIGSHEISIPFFQVELYHQSLAYYINKLTKSIISQ